MTDLSDERRPIAMKNGDIYFWRWKDDKRHADCAPFRSYHCYSRKAVVRDGALYDTYWSDHRNPLTMDDVIITYQGNPDRMAAISEGDANYYRSEDLVDMRHGNSSSAKIYVKTGVQRNPAVMREYLEHEIEKAESSIRVAQRHIELLDDAISLLDNGHFDLVRL